MESDEIGKGIYLIPLNGYIYFVSGVCLCETRCNM